MRNYTHTLFLLFLTSLAFSQTWESNKAKLETNGCLSYEEDANKNRIPDFSHAGYLGGGVAIPSISVKQTISPIAGDNTTNIQDAINLVSALTPDANGFRGAVLLNPGRYAVSGQIFLNTSGVVLRGTSDGRDSQDTTIIYGTGNVPAQRDLIVLGGGTNTKWSGQVSGSKQNITSDFVQVGSRTFEIEDASNYSVGDNIIIYHPCSNEWLTAINGGGTATEPDWTENQNPIIFNRYVTAVSGNEISIDAPVYNHLDRSLSQSYIYKYDRSGIITNVGIENIRVEVESLGGEDENHVWNAVQFTQVEDAWVQNATITGYGLSGVRTETASRVSVINVHSLDPVAQVIGGRMYNFNSYTCSNNILFDNCYARNGRHHYVSNGVGSVSGFVVLNCVSENPSAASEGHRLWTTGMLFDNLKDIGTYPESDFVMGFYNRGDYGSGHGWSAAHSVFWNCEVDRPGKDAVILVEEPPTAQNYAIGCKGNLSDPGPFNEPVGYIEGSNLEAELVPNSLYEAQLLCRTGGVLSDFDVSEENVAVNESVFFKAETQGSISDYSWDFGVDASPSTATGIGPYTVTYISEGLKTVSLQVSNGNDTHKETKTAFINVNSENLFAVNDSEAFSSNDSIITSILDNDTYPSETENYAYSFDGINDNIVYNKTSLLNQYPFTMMAWVKTSSTTGQTVLYSGNPFSGISGNSLSIRSGKATLEAWNYNGSTTKENITDPNTINDGEWHHIAGVFVNASERHLYVDGELIGSSSAILGNLTTQDFSMLSVGNRNDSSPGDWFNGSVDEVRMYASTLSIDNINSIMQGKDCSDHEKLLYWDFNGSSTEIARDNFNLFNGTITETTQIPSNLEIGLLGSEIEWEPKNGDAYLTNDNEVVYTPDLDYVGFDTLTYKLSIGECENSSAEIIYLIDEVTGVKQISETRDFLYPNPTQGISKIDNLENIKSLKLYSASGKFLYELPVTKNVDLKDLGNGVYILISETNEGVFNSNKVVKF